MPYRLPDNMDVFSWGIPFLVDTVLAMTHMVRYRKMLSMDKKRQIEEDKDALFQKDLMKDEI